jgi:hypothetical protein
MPKRLTYLLGAGASANAIPLVNSLTERFKLFCNHLSYYFENKIDNVELSTFKLKQNSLIKAIENHYTIDTYAKKLFLQNKNLHTNNDYNILIKYLSAYFIYEQLNINTSDSCNRYLEEIIYPVMFSEGYEDPNIEKVKKILIDFDYRYDSFFASMLEVNKNNELTMPDEVNIISWNYDFQIEKAFMNFSNSSLDDAMCRLNVVGTPHNTFDRDSNCSHVIKLNGTAGFASKNKYDSFFDFSKHSLDDSSFGIFSDILLKRKSSYENGIRFSWENNSLSQKVINLAQYKLSLSDIIVVIGYSFPYFNRVTDRHIFKNALTNQGAKIYIQAPGKDVSSIINRFEGVLFGANPIPFTELDQFLIPNEM